jgi:hypothetical protein
MPEMDTPDISTFKTRLYEMPKPCQSISASIPRPHPQLGWVGDRYRGFIHARKHGLLEHIGSQAPGCPVSGMSVPSLQGCPDLGPVDDPFRENDQVRAEPFGEAELELSLLWA